MKTAVILGAGAMGKKLARLLNKNGVRLLAYGDNNATCHDSESQVPILSVEAALALAPEVVYVGVASKARSEALCEQARHCGYRGEVRMLCEGAQQLDVRAATLQALLPRLAGVAGDVAELGVYRGDFAWQLNLAFPVRTLHLFDTFSGFDAADVAIEANVLTQEGKVDFSDTSVEAVYGRMPYPSQVVVHAGFFPESAQDLEVRFALVSLDADLYAPTLAGLEYFMPRLARGGVILLHDYDNPRFDGVARAVHTYEASHGPLLLVPLPDLHGTAVIIKP